MSNGECVKPAVVIGASSARSGSAAGSAWSEDASARRRTRTLLMLGAAVGLGAAIASITVRGGGPAMPDDAIAIVNGTAISTVDLERAVTAVAADRRDPIGPEERTAILDRLIEEELLVQRARELGLDAHDRGVRARLVAAMVEAILADVAPPSRAEVEELYRRAGGVAAGERVWVKALRVENGDDSGTRGTQERAREAVARLRAGEDFDAVARDLAVSAVAPLPAGLVPPAKLREYLGPSLTSQALALAPGDVTEPIPDGGAYHVLQLVARDAPAPPEIDAIDAGLRTELRRRADDRALRAYLDRLRAEANVRTRPQGE